MFDDPLLLPFFRQRGYEAPATRKPPCDLPFWDWGSLGLEVGVEWEPVPPALPSALILEVELRGVPLTGPSPIVQAIVEGEALRPVPLYAQRPDNPLWTQGTLWAGVELLHTGRAFYEEAGLRHPFTPSTRPHWGLSLQPGECVYCKPFATEHQSITESLTRTPEGALRRTPPGTIHRVMRPYAGFWDPKMRTTEPLMAEPVFYEVMERYPGETAIVLTRKSQLPRAHCVFFPTPSAAEGLSLPEVIVEGGVTLDLRNPGSLRETVTYRSIHYALTPSRTVEITLKPSPLPQKGSPS